MADNWKTVTIDGLPYGWARMSSESKRIVLELCLHENHVSYAEGYALRIVDKDPTLQEEPVEPGFYKIEDESGRVYLKSAATSRWVVCFADGSTRWTNWYEISKQLCGHRLVAI